MSTMTKTGALGVNAAFLHEIKSDSVEMTNLLDATYDALCVQAPNKIRPGVLHDILFQIRDYLAMHFALEDEFGYFDEAIDVPFDLSCRADILQAQHERFFSEICQIVEQAAKLVYENSTNIAAIKQTVNAYLDFYNRFQDHEAAERELVFESMKCFDVEGIEAETS